jgi:hypothetical protein
VIPKLYEPEEDTWSLDNGASNNMTGNRSYFSEMNERIIGKVRFGDDSCKRERLNIIPRKNGATKVNN